MHDAPLERSVYARDRALAVGHDITDGNLDSPKNILSVILRIAKSFTDRETIL